MSYMNSYFENITASKLGDPFAQKQRETLIEGLDPELQSMVRMTILMCQIDAELHTLKLKGFVDQPKWMVVLTEKEKQQVIAYIASCPLGEHQQDALNWYEKEKRFRYERTI